MPITYVIDRFRQRKRTQAEGLVSFADITAHLDGEARDHGLDLPEVIDARSATTNITPEEVRRLVHRIQQMTRTQPFGPTAIVATNDFVFGMARMFSILMEPSGIAADVFRDVPSAEAWLDHVSCVSPGDRARKKNDPVER
jgi:hypothetical protein